jgi:rhodanese-related sulfurtransferase
MPRSPQRAKKSGRRNRIGRTTRPFWILVVLIVSVIAVVSLVARFAGGASSGEYTREISPQDLNAMIGNGAMVVDVRQREEYAAGHIANSLSIPLDELDARLSTLPSDRTIITVCQTGVRSMQALYILQEAGFPQIASLQGGIDAWVSAGYPLQYSDPVS